MVNYPILGKSLIEYWLERLVELGAREVIVLATDRPEEVRRRIGDGSRWGIRVEVFPEWREKTRDEAYAKYRQGDSTEWLAAPNDITQIDHFPGLQEICLLDGYSQWSEAVLACLGLPDWVKPGGIRNVNPGIFIGARARIAPTATLLAPCWIGNDVQIGAGAVVGPGTILEDSVLIEEGSEISTSIVGPETMVGPSLQLKDSIAWGSSLTHCLSGSCTRIADPFLLRSLNPEFTALQTGNLIGRAIAVVVMILALPLFVWAIFKSKWRRQPAFRLLIGVRPQAQSDDYSETFVFSELTALRGILRRLPQLWNVARGDLAWVGNRPLSPSQAAELSTDFERLWFASPVGLVSVADVPGGSEIFSDESRAHASFYSVQADRQMDLKILARVIMGAFPSKSQSST